MAIIYEIMAERDAGVAHCGLLDAVATSPSAVAKQFGLREDPEIYEEIPLDEARHLIESILYQDLAYGQPLMDQGRAKGLAERFLALFDAKTRFFSNGWQPGGTTGWNPATDATFDTGVIAIGQKSGCLWVEDED